MKVKQAALLLGGGLALLALVVTIVVSTSSNTTVSATATTPSPTPPVSSTTTAPTTGSLTTETTAKPEPKCVTGKVMYFAAQAPAGSNNFGPTQSYSDVKAAIKRLNTKLCGGDPLFAATMVAYKEDGLKLSADSVEAQAKAYASSKKAWSAAVQKFLDSVESMKVIDDPHTYQTLGMVPNGTSQPSLIRSTQRVVAGKVLVIRFKDGAVRKLRIVCDLQPVEDVFPYVPPAPPPAQTSPPSTSTHVTQPSTVPSTAPSTPTTAPSTPSTPRTSTTTSHVTTSTPLCPSGPNKGQPISEQPHGICPSGKTASNAPPPTGGPVVTATSGYVDRTGGVHNSTTYQPPAPSTTASSPGKGDSGPGATNTAPNPPTPSTTVTVPSSMASPTTNPPGPPPAGG